MWRKSCCKIALILFDYFVKSAWSFPPWLPWYIMQKMMKFRWEGQEFMGCSSPQDLQNSTREILNKTFLRGWCFREEGSQIQVEIIKSSMLNNFINWIYHHYCHSCQMFKVFYCRFYANSKDQNSRHNSKHNKHNSSKHNNRTKNYWRSNHKIS